MREQRLKGTIKTKTAKVTAGAVAIVAATVFALSMALPGFGASSWQRITDPDTSSLIPGQNVSPISTAEAGRIYTDKSVTQSSTANQFDVQLSALSSTLNEASQTNQPLDVVLVLDVSGSMYERYGTATFSEVTPAYMRAHKDKTFYIPDSSGSYYDPVRWSSESSSYDYWYYVTYPNYREYTSKTSNYASTRFYEMSTGTSKMDSLKTSVNTFLDNFSKLNASASPSNKNRVAIVKFAGDERTTQGNDLYSLGNYGKINYSQVVNGFTDDPASLKTSVNSLVAGGSTRSDYGMNRAKSLLDADTSGHKKVVIFFSDGLPTSGGSYSPTVAGSAIDTSRSLANNGNDSAEVYSIAATADADPSDVTGQMNRFMNAMSNNYPAAQSNSSAPYGIQLGTRADGDYYFGAASSQDLAKAFDNIYSQIATSTSGYATKVDSNDAADTSG